MYRYLYTDQHQDHMTSIEWYHSMKCVSLLAGWQRLSWNVSVRPKILYLSSSRISTWHWSSWTMPNYPVGGLRRTVESYTKKCRYSGHHSSSVTLCRLLWLEWLLHFPLLCRHVHQFKRTVFVHTCWRSGLSADKNRAGMNRRACQNKMKNAVTSCSRCIVGNLHLYVQNYSICDFL